VKQRKKVNCKTLFNLLVTPVDRGKSIQDVGNKVKKIPFKKRIQILKDRIEQENDEDIKKSQEKGILLQ